jgi:hypothetical protein
MISITSFYQPIRRPLAALTVLALTAGMTPLFAQVAGATAGIKITVKEGEGALNNIRTLKAKDPVVLITDAADKPLSGAQVAFLLPDLGASGVFPSGTTATVTTGPDGLATIRGMKPNNVVGQFQIRITASYQGHVARAAINQTNAAPQKSGGGGGKTALIVALVGGAGAAVAVGVTRGNKSPSTPTQPNPTTSISAGGSTFGPPR